MIDKTYSLFIVKWNRNKTVRFARFSDFLSDTKNRLEVEIRNLSEEEAANPNWQQYCMIWWKHNSSLWYEATRDDAKAEAEYQEVVLKLKNYPDIDPDMPEQPNAYGTLIRSFALGKQYQVVDGVGRT